MNPINCLDCERRKNQLFAQLDHLRKKVKQKAIEQQLTYSIWLDTEDATLHDSPVGQERGEVIEYVSFNT